MVEKFVKLERNWRSVGGAGGGKDPDKSLDRKSDKVADRGLNGVGSGERAHSMRRGEERSGRFVIDEGGEDGYGYGHGGGGDVDGVGERDRESENLEWSIHFDCSPGAVPFKWEDEPGKPKRESAGKARTSVVPLLQPPPSRVLLLSRESYQAGLVPVPMSAAGMQLGGSLNPKERVGEKNPKFSLQELLRIKRPSFNSRVDGARHSRQGSMSSESSFKYMEEDSPVSILDRLPTSGKSSSVSSDSPLQSPLDVGDRCSANEHFDSSALPVPHKRGSSFSIPPASHSRRPSAASSQFMASCLLSLDSVLLAGKEEEEDSNGRRGVQGEADPWSPRSPGADSNNEFWSLAPTELQSGPEYHTMDFSDEVLDRHQQMKMIVSVSRNSNPEGTSLFRKHLALPPSRLMIEHTPTSHAEGASLEKSGSFSFAQRKAVDYKDDISVKCKSMGSADHFRSNASTGENAARGREPRWHDRYTDPSLEMAEEVVRDPNGLRFTYSPVASAFVFSRPNQRTLFAYDTEEQEKQRVAQEKQMISHSPQKTETEVSQRFSISLDDYTSGEDESRNFADIRNSSATELGFSRCASWNNNTRGNGKVPVATGETSQMFDDSFQLDVVANQHWPELNSQLAAIDNSHFLKRAQPAKRTAFSTCLPILRILKGIGNGNGRSSRIRGGANTQRQLNWTDTRATY